MSFESEQGGKRNGPTLRHSLATVSISNAVSGLKIAKLTDRINLMDHLVVLPQQENAETTLWEGLLKLKK